MLSLKKNLFIKRIRDFLIIGFSKRAGKNCFGRKTIFTQSGGYKLFYNNVDFKRNLADIFVLLHIEKSILYTSYLGFICYSNGYFCYIFLSDFIKNLKTIYSGFVTYYKYAPSFLSLIPAGNFIHHIEVTPTKGVQMMRAAGTMGFIISKENDYSYLKMKSGWMLKLSKFCIAILGKMSNELHFVTRIKNAGKNRKLGFRPTVRGVAKNPVDHPHGVVKEQALRLKRIKHPMENWQNRQLLTKNFKKEIEYYLKYLKKNKSMSRSLYKPKFVHKSLFDECLINKEKNIMKKNNINFNDSIGKNIPRFLYFWAKGSSLNLNLLDKKVSIYNGRVFISLSVIKQIMGYKLGSFCITRKKPPHIGKQKQVKKVSKANKKLVADRKEIINRNKEKFKKIKYIN